MCSVLIRILTCTVVAAALPGAAEATPHIYRCEIGGVTAYEDRPCGADATAYEPDPARVTTYAPPPVRPEAPRAAPKLKSRKHGGAQAAAQSKRTEECRRIAASLRDIKSRMRAGYSAREGERMRVQKATLDERRRAHKCG